MRFVHAYHTYIWCACTGAWKLAPQGLIPFYNAIYIYIFLIKHHKSNNIENEILKFGSKNGERDELKSLIKAALENFE